MRISLFYVTLFKGRVFEIKIVINNILIAVISVILLIQAIIITDWSLKIFGFMAFFSFLIVGFMLSKVTKKEIQQREKVENLAKELTKLNRTLEDRVKERTQELEKNYNEIKEKKDELEKFHNITMGRELKMIGLKEKIEELEKKLASH